MERAEVLLACVLVRDGVLSVLVTEVLGGTLLESLLLILVLWVGVLLESVVVLVVVVSHC